MAFGMSPGMGAQAAITPQQKKKTPLEEAMDILGSKGGQVAVQGLGAAADAYGQHQQTQQIRQDNLANRQQSAQQFNAQMQEGQLGDDRNLQLAQAKGAADASPMGEAQLFAQRNALLQQILGGARNFSAMPGDPAVAEAMGGSTNFGGLRLPEGGLDPAMLQRLYGDQATLGSIQNRQQAIGQINPNAQVQDLGSMFGQAGTDASALVQGQNDSLAAQQAADTAKRREMIQRAIDEDIAGARQPQQEKKKSGGNIFGKILKGVGSAASFIPGVGQVVAPIASGIGGLVNGDGLKSALGNAALSAIPLGAGKVAKMGATGAKIAKGGNIAAAILGRG